MTLGVYVLLWTAYATIAKGSQGFHFDMVEVIAWSRDLSHGYLKHPPLAAAVAWAWFAIFPVAEWSYYLLAMTMPALTLWIVWHLSADYLDADKRIAGLALLMLVPFFHFHALKFNVNTVLMPLWAATTFWFLRSIKTRSSRHATLAGVAAPVACSANTGRCSCWPVSWWRRSPTAAVRNISGRRHPISLSSPASLCCCRICHGCATTTSRRSPMR